MEIVYRENVHVSMDTKEMHVKHNKHFYNVNQVFLVPYAMEMESVKTTNVFVILVIMVFTVKCNMKIVEIIVLVFKMEFVEMINVFVE